MTGMLVLLLITPVGSPVPVPARPNPGAGADRTQADVLAGLVQRMAEPVVAHYVREVAIKDLFEGAVRGLHEAAGVPVLGWGQFLTVVINFLILAFIIFLLVRYANKLMKRGEEAAGPTEVDLLTEIRDELKKRS